MQRTLNLQNIARLTRISKVILLWTLNSYPSIQGALSAHLLNSYISTSTVISLASNQSALLLKAVSSFGRYSHADALLSQMLRINSGTGIALVSELLVFMDSEKLKGGIEKVILLRVPE